MARRTDSRRAIISTGLRPLRPVSRLPRLVWQPILCIVYSIRYNARMTKKQTDSISDQLRQAIDDSGQTRYRIAKETGISESALAQFYNGHRGLSMEALNSLGEFLQLKITLGRKPDQREAK
jgi:hypothetical protein